MSKYGTIRRSTQAPTSTREHALRFNGLLLQTIHFLGLSPDCIGSSILLINLFIFAIFLTLIVFYLNFIKEITAKRKS
jgi:hypothetical protein